MSLGSVLCKKKPSPFRITGASATSLGMHCTLWEFGEPTGNRKEWWKNREGRWYHGHLPIPFILFLDNLFCSPRPQRTEATPLTTSTLQCTSSKHHQINLICHHWNNQRQSQWYRLSFYFLGSYSSLPTHLKLLLLTQQRFVFFLGGGGGTT